MLINTTNKEKNQIIVGRIKKSKNKLSEMKDYSNEWAIQPNNQRINLLNTIDLILNFNEKFNQDNENKNEDNKNENKIEDSKKESKNEEEETFREEDENEKNQNDKGKKMIFQIK